MKSRLSLLIIFISYIFYLQVINAEEETEKIGYLDFMRSVLKHGSDAIALSSSLNHNNYFGSCLIEGTPKILKKTRIIGQYIIKFKLGSEEECWCTCLGFDGCVASFYAWETCHLYDVNHKQIQEEGFNSYVRESFVKVEYSYIGCYEDKTTRDLEFFAYLEYQRNTNDYCAHICDSFGYTYFGTQHGNECFCGDSYGKYGTSNNCNMACLGNTFEICGGPHANSVSRIIRDP